MTSEWPAWFVAPSANSVLETLCANTGGPKVSTSRLQAAYGPLMKTGTEAGIPTKRLCTNEVPRSYIGLLSGSVAPSTEYVFPYIVSNLQPSVARELHSLNDFIALFTIHQQHSASTHLPAMPSSIGANHVRNRLADNADTEVLTSFIREKVSELRKDGVEVTYDGKRKHWSLTGDRLHEYSSFPEIRHVVEAVDRATETEATVQRLRMDVARAVLGVNAAIAECSQAVQTSVRTNMEGLLKAQAEITYVESLSLYDTAKVEDARNAFQEQAAVALLLGAHVTSTVQEEKTALDTFIETEYMGYTGGVSGGGGEGGRLRGHVVPVTPSQPSSPPPSEKKDAMNTTTAASLLVGNVALHAVLESKLGAKVDAKTITRLSNTLYQEIHDSKNTNALDRLHNAAIAVHDNSSLGVGVLQQLRTHGFQI